MMDDENDRILGEYVKDRPFATWREGGPLLQQTLITGWGTMLISGNTMWQCWHSTHVSNWSCCAIAQWLGWLLTNFYQTPCFIKPTVGHNQGDHLSKHIGSVHSMDIRADMQLQIKCCNLNSSYVNVEYVA